jgi:hypothetical protein
LNSDRLHLSTAVLVCSNAIRYHDKLNQQASQERVAASDSATAEGATRSETLRQKDCES